MCSCLPCFVVLRKERRKSKKRKSISCREYYCYKLQIRPKIRTILLHAKRLLQQYSVDMYIKLETSRLDYFRNKHEEIRAHLYQGFVDSVVMGEIQARNIGKKIILPASFIGGPIDMRKRYVDAMALVQRFRKPDIFLTMTCNPNWPEIKKNYVLEKHLKIDRTLLHEFFMLN